MDQEKLYWLFFLIQCFFGISPKLLNEFFSNFVGTSRLTNRVNFFNLGPNRSIPFKITVKIPIEVCKSLKLGRSLKNELYEL